MQSAIYTPECARVQQSLRAKHLHRVNGVAMPSFSRLGDHYPSRKSALTTAPEGLHRLLLQPGQMTYANRLQGLAKHVKKAVPGVTGNTQEWVQREKNARNGLAHQLEHGFLGENDADEWIALLLSMQWVLRGTLLLKTGINEDTLGAVIGNHHAYQLFLTQARTWLPAVF